MVAIGGLSQKTGCHIGTIRYYETIGLLPKPLRSEGGTGCMERIRSSVWYLYGGAVSWGSLWIIFEVC